MGDVDKRSQLRLDATARYLQDIATDDIGDAGLAEPYGWVVRRTTMVIEHPAVLDERVELVTWCTGLGRSWAERSTSLTGEHGAAAHTVSTWVQVDPTTSRPAGLTSGFVDIYGPSADGRKVSPRLSLAGPNDVNTLMPWQIRVADLDPFDHVNNAAHWAFVEEVVNQRGSGRVGIFDLEFLNPIVHGDDVAIRVAPNASEPGWSAWLTAKGSVHTAVRWRPALS